VHRDDGFDVKFQTVGIFEQVDLIGIGRVDGAALACAGGLKLSASTRSLLLGQICYEQSVAMIAPLKFIQFALKWMF